MNDFILQIIFSILLGSLIGLEREYAGKDVGVRTLALITLGATLYCLMSPTIFNGDNSRIIAQIVSGIGFLGAGIIFKNDKNVHGLTTAATIWAAAAIGCLVGIQMYLEAFVGTCGIILINNALSKLKRND